MALFADAHALDHIDGRDRTEETVELRAAGDQRAPRDAAVLRDFAHDLGQGHALLHGNATAHGQRRQRQGAKGALERAHCVGAQSEVLRDALALLGEAQHATGHFRGRGAQQRVDASAAARDAAAPAVEQHVAVARPIERARERPLGAVGGVARSHHAALAAALGIVDQHGLHAPARSQMPLVGRVGQQLRHHFTAPLEARDAVELRRDIDGGRTALAVARACPMRQHQRRQHVGRGGRAADDVQTHSLRTVAMPALADGFENRQCAPRQRIEGAAGRGVAIE